MTEARKKGFWRRARPIAAVSALVAVGAISGCADEEEIPADTGNGGTAGTGTGGGASGKGGSGGTAGAAGKGGTAGTGGAGAGGAGAGGSSGKGGGGAGGAGTGGGGSSGKGGGGTGGGGTGGGGSSGKGGGGTGGGGTGGGGTGGGTSCPVVTGDGTLATKTKLADGGTTFVSPFDAVPSPDGSTVYFTAIDVASGKGAVYSVPAAGGTVTTIAVGMVAPTGIAVSGDGKTLYVADEAGAEDAADFTKDAGLFYTVGTAANSTPTVAAKGSRPHSVTVAHDASCKDVVYVGTHNGDTPTISTFAAGAFTTAVTTKFEASGIAAAADGTLYWVETVGGPWASIQTAKAGGAGTLVTAGLYVGYPAGLALSPDGKNLVLSALAPADGTDSLVKLDTAGKTLTQQQPATDKTTVEAAGMHRALDANVFAFVDGLGSTGTGAVYLVKPLGRGLSGGSEMKTANCVVAALAALGVIGIVGTANASSHREAPAIANDGAADNTDLWAWHEGDAATGTLHVVAAYIPLQEPSGGPNYPKFSDDVLYEIHVARGSSSLDDVVTYQIKFTTAPIAKVDPGDLAKPLGGGKEFYAQLAGSYAQTYSVTQVIAGKATTLVSGVEVPAPSIGPRTQTVALGLPGADKAAYEAYALSKAKTFDVGGATGKVWAGQRDDGFYVDLAGAFDLANFHVADNLFAGGPPAQDNVAGYNCHAIAIDIPFAAIPKVADAADKYKDRLGVWASASRRKVRILRNDGSEQWAGPWTQVSRMGMPLVNELVIGLQDKDKYNRTAPKGDVANFAGYILNPVIVRDAEAVGLYAALKAKLGYADLDTACNGGSCKSGRTDIVGALNIGAADFPLTSSGDVIRVDPGVGAAGFPNGRPLPYSGTPTNAENDVTDVMASIALYGFPSGLSGGPGAFCGGGACKLGDGVNYNDTNYPGTFPYLATPWRGWDEGHGKPTPLRHGVTAVTTSPGARAPGLRRRIGRVAGSCWKRVRLRGDRPAREQCGYAR